MPAISVRTAASVAMLAALALLCWFAIGCGGDDEQADNEQNVEATIEAVIAETSATRAAQNEATDPTVGSTGSTTAAATPIVVSTANPNSQANPVTNVPATPDPLAALPVSNAESFLGSVSQSERACLSQAVSPDRLTVLLESPESTTDDERAALIQCLEYDTQLRLFLTPVLTATGPLSDSSSACLRGSFADANVGMLMMAATSGPGSNVDPEAAMTAAMVSSMVSLSCLSEDEFQSAGPAMGAGPEEYESFQCVSQEVGGPKRMAELMHPGFGFPTALFEAAFACDVQVAGTPSG